MIIDLRRNFWSQLLKVYAKKHGDESILEKSAIITMLDSIEANLSDQTINAMFSLMKKSSTDTLNYFEAIEMLEMYVRSPSNEGKGESIIGLPCCFICKIPFKQFKHDIQKATHLSICSFRQLDAIDMLGITTNSHGWCYCS